MLVFVRLRAQPIEVMCMPMGVRGTIGVRVFVYEDARIDGRITVLQQLLMGWVAMQHRSILQARCLVRVEQGCHGWRTQKGRPEYYGGGC